MIKNGGNVVSYFCTPEGRLIHAVGGPVDANRLLEEARWAADAFTNVQAANRHRGAAILREAHMVASATVHSTQRVGHWTQQNSFDQSRVHRLLAKYAYLPMSQVETTLFRSLTGENFAADRTTILEAAKTFKSAAKRNRPILLILGSQSNERLANANTVRPGTIGCHLQNYHAKRYLRKFSVVYVPKNQLAAFTNLRELTGWDKLDTVDNSWEYRDTCLLISSSGEILSKLDLDDPDRFADQLKSALNTWKQDQKDSDVSKST